MSGVVIAEMNTHMCEKISMTYNECGRRKVGNPLRSAA